MTVKEIDITVCKRRMRLEGNIYTSDMLRGVELMGRRIITTISFMLRVVSRKIQRRDRENNLLHSSGGSNTKQVHLKVQ